MADPKGDKHFQDFKLAESATIVESVVCEQSTSLAVVEETKMEVLSSPQASLWKASEDRSGNHSGTFVAPPYKGLTRHRLIVSSCVLLAFGIFAVSAVNLQPLIESEGEIDSNLQVVLRHEKPKLSPGLAISCNGEAKDGLMKVREKGWTSTLEGYVDESGKVVIAPRFGDTSDFSEGLAAFSDEKKTALVGAPVKGKAGAKKAKLKNLYGFIDRTGRVAITPRFSSVGAFEKGVALVSKGEDTLLIDKAGKVLFSTSDLPRPVASVLGGDDRDDYRLESNEMMVTGEPLNLYGYESSNNNFWGDLAAISLGYGQRGLIDRTGRVVVQPQYDAIFPACSDGLAGHTSVNEWTQCRNHAHAAFLVSKGHKWGVLDPNGKELFAPKFQRILSYQNHHAAVMVGEKYGFADAKGDIVIKPEYDFVTAFDKIIAVKKGKVWSFIDSTGKPMSAPPVDGIIHTGRGVWLSDGLGAVTKGNKVGYLNTTGQFAVQPQFTWALAFANGYAPACTDWLWHYIDKSGKRVSEDFVRADSLVNGKATVVVPGKIFAFAKLPQYQIQKAKFDNWHKVVAGRADKPDE